MNRRSEPQDLARAVRQACLEVAEAAWLDAGIRGLCAEGRWELALQAIRELDLAPLLQDGSRSDSG